MKKCSLIIYVSLLCVFCQAQHFNTIFETSNGTASATYSQVISFYAQLARSSPKIRVQQWDTTDAGYPLHLILFSNTQDFTPANWRKKNKLVLLVNNGIHPGEPDGIDASMLLLRDMVTGNVKMPDNIVLAVIPVYNIGGALNRNSYSRVNQQGPLEYGFRGNAQNLDLNRDFTKNDSKNARAFVRIYHHLQPHIFMDNHVSDGADYQHTMTLLSTQHNKLGYAVGELLNRVVEPALYDAMRAKNFPMCPYVSFEEGSPEKGWVAFNDAPRYSSGYTSLFQTIGFTPETHMLKPFAERVRSTYALMLSMVEVASKHADEILKARALSIAEVSSQKSFPLQWRVDTSRHDTIRFLGYEAAYKTSEVTGATRLFYDRTKPYEKRVKFYNLYAPKNMVQAPQAYIIPQGWWQVIDLLKLNKVILTRLERDTIIEVETYRIDSYKSTPNPYEKHHRNYDVQTSTHRQKINCRKGDYLIRCNQPANRYIVEMLEPTGDDSFFAWNFFDAILQQKEGYSAYRWEDVAAAFLRENPSVRQELEERKKADASFAASAAAQLDFVYKRSPWYEPAHLRYPVYRWNPEQH